MTSRAWHLMFLHMIGVHPVCTLIFLWNFRMAVVAILLFYIIASVNSLKVTVCALYFQFLFIFKMVNLLLIYHNLYLHIFMAQRAIINFLFIICGKQTPYILALKD